RTRSAGRSCRGCARLRARGVEAAEALRGRRSLPRRTAVAVAVRRTRDRQVRRRLPLAAPRLLAEVVALVAAPLVAAPQLVAAQRSVARMAAANPAEPSRLPRSTRH